MNKSEIIALMINEALDRERLARYYEKIGNKDYEKVNRAFADAFRQCAVIVELKLTED